jgi:hypothetical protein
VRQAPADVSTAAIAIGREGGQPFQSNSGGERVAERIVRDQLLAHAPSRQAALDRQCGSCRKTSSDALCRSRSPTAYVTRTSSQRLLPLTDQCRWGFPSHGASDPHSIVTRSSNGPIYRTPGCGSSSSAVSIRAVALQAYAVPPLRGCVLAPITGPTCTRFPTSSLTCVSERRPAAFAWQPVVKVLAVGPDTDDATRSVVT